MCCSLQLFSGNDWGGSTCNAQGHWTQKADFGGTPRYQSVGFSIGTKGYIGTGFQNAGNTRDFWEWEQSTNVWTQKADFGGTARTVATGFSIGTKGYIGTGFEDGIDLMGAFTKDFWEWDQATNIWTQKADFGGTARTYATGFSIGTNGYIGAGQQDPDFSNTQDFWEYNPATDTWTQKANFGGGLRAYAVGFSIGNLGYMGTGHDGSLAHKDFWEFDPVTNVWTQKADVGLFERFFATGFSIGTKGYIGTGVEAPDFAYSQTFLEWDQASNTWIEQADFPGAPRSYAVGFSIGNKGYIGTGLDTGFITHNDFWEFSTDSLPVTCSTPTNPHTTNVTAVSAILNWNVSPGAISYFVRYKVAGTVQWTKKTALLNFKKIKNLLPGTTYVWQARSICANGSSIATAQQTFTTISTKLSVEQAISFQVFPDPFESSATISFSLREDSRVQLELYDVAGRKMQTVLDDNMAAGNHSLTLNRNELNGGIYFLKMRMNNPDESGQVEVITKKVMIVQ